MQSGPCESRLLLLDFKIIFYITTRGTLKDGQTRFLRLFHWTHIVSQAAVRTVAASLAPLQPTTTNYFLHNIDNTGTTMMMM
jgi:hypothetical protein